MATPSPATPAWYKPSFGGSRPASNQRGYGSGAAGASARRFLRSARGGVAAVMDRMQDEDRNSAMDREDAIRREAWGREDKRYDDAQQAQKAQNDAEWEIINGGTAPPTQGSNDGQIMPLSSASRLLASAAPIGTTTNPTTGVMSAPSMLSTTANITPGISENPTQVASPPVGGVTKIFSQYGSGNNAPVAQVATAPVQGNGMSVNGRNNTAWQPNGDLGAAGTMLANLQAGTPAIASGATQTALTSPDAVAIPEQPQIAPTAPNPLVSPTSVASLNQPEMTTPAGDLMRAVGSGLNKAYVAPVKNAAANLLGRASGAVNDVNTRINKAVGTAVGSAVKAVQPVTNAAAEAKRWITPRPKYQ